MPDNKKNTETTAGQGDQADAVKRAIELLKAVYRVREYQEKPSLANQGQCLDGYLALANYNDIADEIKTFLDENTL